MKKLIKPGLRLKSMQLSGGSMLALSLASPSFAACAPDPTVAFETVICSGTDSDGLIIDSNQTTVNVEDGAVVSTILTTTRVTAANPFDSFNFITINLDGAVTDGITIDSGTIEAGLSSFPSTTTSLVVGANGAVRGATAIGFDNDLSIPFGSAIIDINNSGIIESTTGPAILATNATRQGVGNLVNMEGGRIGGIHVPVRSLDNQGAIDGGLDSAIRYAIAAGSAVFPSFLSNSGTIESNSDAATLDFDTGFLQINNQGSIVNDGAGDAIAANSNSPFSTLVITNEMDGKIAASAGAAIRSDGGISLTNSGTVTGAVLSGGILNLTNRGTIDGTVNAQISGSQFGQGSFIDNSNGGVITRRVTLSDGNDTVVVDYGSAAEPLTGFEGGIDAGLGFDRLTLNFVTSAELTAPVAVASFEEFGFVIASGQTLTLADGFTAASNVSVQGAFLGSPGKLINRAVLDAPGQALFVNGAVDVENAGSLFTIALQGTSSFANSGSIGGGANLSVAGEASNSGSILADGRALSINFGGFNNSGSIRSSQDTAVSISSSGQDFVNSGDIDGVTGGIEIFSSQQDKIINTGTISASAGSGISLFFDGIVDNRVGGTISGSSAAITTQNGRVTIINAGMINGDVNFGPTFGSENIFVARSGGIVDGDVNFGSANGLFVTSLSNSGAAEFQEVTGDITGTGFLGIRYLVEEDTVTTLAQPSGVFDGVGYELSNNAALMITNSTVQAFPVTFDGNGSVDLDADISSTGPNWTILVGGNSVADRDTLPSIDLISRGTITRTRDPLSNAISPVAAILVNSGSSFTNEGTIVVNDPASPPFGGPAIAGISGQGAIVNNGVINLNGGVGISGSDILNTGMIVQQPGGVDGKGVLVAGSLDNKGTVITGGNALAVDTFFDSLTGQSAPTIVTNSGTIESTNGAAIIEMSDFGASSLRQIVNQSTGIITGAAGQAAIQMNGFTEIDNAGVINGDVNLGTAAPPFFFESFSSNTYINRSGSLNGNLTFGRGNDTFISFGEDTGVTGTIDAGEGTDTFVQAYTANITVNAANAVLPSTFERIGFGAIGADTIVTVTGPSTGLDFGPQFFGDGTIINRANVNTRPNPDPFGGASPNFAPLNGVSLAPPGFTSGAAGLSFINEAELLDGVDGVVRSFENSGTIGQENLQGVALGLTLSGSDTLNFKNSGDILASGNRNRTGLRISTDFQRAIADTISISNDGEIRANAFVSVDGKNVGFVNDGLIASVAPIPNPFFNSPSAIIFAAGDGFSNDGSFDRVAQTVMFTNNGEIDGPLILDVAALDTVFENSGTITGGEFFRNAVEISAGRLTTFSVLGNINFDQESLNVSNSGTIAGRLKVEGAVIETVVDNSGSIVVEQPVPNGFRSVSPGTALALANITSNNQTQNVTNSGEIISSAFGSGAISLAAEARFQDGVSMDENPTAAITFVNNGTVRADSGAIITPDPMILDSFISVEAVAALAAVAVSSGTSSVNITNEASGAISSIGMPRGPGPDFSVLPGFAAGDSSVAVFASADNVSVSNAGTITGGAGDQLPEGSFLQIGIDVALLNVGELLPDRYLAGAIHTLHSKDVVSNSGTINGSIDLGALSDVLENRGTINGNIFLRDGDDVFVQGSTGVTNGMVDGGLGADILDIDSTGSTGQGFDLEQFINFETVAVSGTGTIGLAGDLQFETVMLNGGSLEIAEGESLSTTGPVTITGGGGNEMVTNRGTISGAVELGDGEDTLANFGTILGSVDLGAGDDTFTHTTNSITASVSGGAGNDLLTLELAGTQEAPDSLDIANFSDFETLQQNSGFIRISDQLSFANINLVDGRLIGEAGSIITSDVITVASGATFGSAGTVNADIVVNGTLSPGASPGTMTVAGDVDFGSGSTTVFEIAPTVSDQLIVTGAISVADGAVLNLIGNRPLTPGAPLNLVTSADGIAGSFIVNKGEEIFGFIRQQANAIQLIGLFSVDFGFSSQVATTVAYTNEVLQSGDASSALVDALPQLTTSAGTTNGAAFAQLSPEAYASAGQIGIENGLAISRSLRGDQLNPSTAEAGLFTFANGFGNWRRMAGNASIGTSRANIRNSGIVGGIGFGSEKGSLAAVIGVVNARQSIGALGTTTEADGIVLGALGNFFVDRFRGSASFIFDGSSADTDRTLPGGGSVIGGYKMRGWTADISATYAMPVADNWLVEPQVGLTHISSRRAGVNENSNNPFTLDIVGQRYRGTFIDATFALRGGQKEGAAIRPWISAGLRHQLNNGTTSATAGFSGLATTLTISGTERRDTLLTFGAGIEADIGKSTTVFAGYSGEFAGGGGSNQAQVGVRVGF